MGLFDLLTKRRQRAAHQQTLAATEALDVLCESTVVEFAELEASTPERDTMFTDRLIAIQKIMNHLLSGNQSDCLHHEVHGSVMARFFGADHKLNEILKQENQISADDKESYMHVVKILHLAKIIQGVLSGDPEYSHSAAGS